MPRGTSACRPATCTRPSRGEAFIGTSGWVYAGWRQHLYADTPAKDWLRVASRAFDSLEINGSFYTQIKPETYARWYAETPPGFRFALKGHRFVTHYKRLRDCEDSIVRLRDQVKPLREKLAAVLWQLPDTFQCDLERLESFTAALGSGPRCATRSSFGIGRGSPPRRRSILADANVSICQSDAPEFPMWREVTTDLVYVRLHGHTRMYASSYAEQSLRTWADDTKRWLDEGRDVHVYFDNDAAGHAVRNALRFQELVVGSAPREVPVAARSGPGACGSAHASPSRRPTAPPRGRAPSARRSTARTGSRERRPGAR